MFERTCLGECGETKPIEQFAKAGKQNGKQYYKTKCKDCYNKDTRRKNAENPEARRAAVKKWQQKNADAVKAGFKKWYEANKEYDNARSLEWRNSNLERARENQRAWAQANYQTVLSHNANYRARKLSATVEQMPSNWRELLLAFYGAKCMYPGCESTQDLAADHIEPLASGGPHCFENLQVLCKPHNSSKKDRHSTDYRDIEKGILIGYVFGEAMILSRPKVKTLDLTA